MSQFKKHHDATNEIVRSHQKGEPVIVDVMGCSWAVTCTDVTKYGNEWGPPRITLEPVAKAAVWYGKGLPPVGVDCEYMKRGTADWFHCTVIAEHDGGVVVAVHEDDLSYSYWNDSGHFRPLRTAEQIAAEAREKAALDMARLMTGHDDRSGDCFQTLGEILYDAGYRKSDA